MPKTKPIPHTAIDISKDRKGPKVARSQDLTKKPTQMLAVRVREMEGVETLALGFRSSLIECSPHGGVSSGAGLGSPWVMVTKLYRQTLEAIANAKPRVHRTACSKLAQAALDHVANP
jgi:hypothetical protein